MVTKVIEDKTYWLKRISEYRHSSFSSKNAYCLQAGVNYHRFLYWYDKLSREVADKNMPSKSEQLIPVQIAAKPKASSSSPLCVLEFKHGHRLLVHHEAALEKLVLLLSR